MIFDGEQSIGMLRRKSTFLKNYKVCDLDLWTYDPENLISSCPHPAVFL